MPSVTLSYAELAARIGRSEIAARSLAQRKRWQRSPGNDGKVRITIDEADLADVAKGDRRMTDGPTDHPRENGTGARATDRPIGRGVTDRPNPVHELQAKLAVAQALANERERELADLRADRDAWRAQAERLGVRPWWRRLTG